MAHHHRPWASLAHPRHDHAVTDKERVGDSDLEEDRVSECDFVCERVFVVDRELDLLFDCVLDRDVDVEEDRDSDIDFDNDRLRVGEEFAFGFFFLRLRDKISSSLDSCDTNDMS
jgi:hypothetical protein